VYVTGTWDVGIRVSRVCWLQDAKLSGKLRWSIRRVTVATCNWMVMDQSPMGWVGGFNGVRSYVRGAAGEQTLCNIKEGIESVLKGGGNTVVICWKHENGPSQRQVCRK
jgi:hypothetical protein